MAARGPKMRLEIGWRFCYKCTSGYAAGPARNARCRRPSGNPAHCCLTIQNRTSHLAQGASATCPHWKNRHVVDQQPANWKTGPAVDQHAEDRPRGVAVQLPPQQCCGRRAPVQRVPYWKNGHVVDQHAQRKAARRYCPQTGRRDACTTRDATAG